MSSRHKYYVPVKINETIVRVPVRVKNAKTTVRLHRTIADVLAGKEGMSISCANAQCALRLASEVFPHPAIMVSFTKNRCYVIDRVDRLGVPIHCVRYAHNQGVWQKKFDRLGKKKVAKLSDADQTFTLSPPPTIKPSKSPVTDGRLGRPMGNVSRHVIHRGDLGRMLEAQNQQ